MTTDIVCAAVLVFFGLVGAWRGFMRQVFSLLAFVLIALFAAPVGVAMAGPVLSGKNWSGTIAVAVKIGFSLGAAVAIYILVKLVGSVVNAALGDRGSSGGGSGPAPWNRYWGAALGIVKAGLLCWLVLCFFTAFPKIAPGVTAKIRSSWSVKTTGLFNPFEHWIGSERQARLRTPPRLRAVPDVRDGPIPGTAARPSREIAKRRGIAYYFRDRRSGVGFTNETFLKDRHRETVPDFRAVVFGS